MFLFDETKKIDIKEKLIDIAYNIDKLRYFCQAELEGLFYKNYNGREYRAKYQELIKAMDDLEIIKKATIILYTKTKEKKSYDKEIYEEIVSFISYMKSKYFNDTVSMSKFQNYLENKENYFYA